MRGLKTCVGWPLTSLLSSPVRCTPSRRGSAEPSRPPVSTSLRPRLQGRTHLGCNSWPKGEVFAEDAPRASSPARRAIRLAGVREWGWLLAVVVGALAFASSAAAITPNDPAWGEAWAQRQVNMPAAWDLTTG